MMSETVDRATPACRAMSAREMRRSRQMRRRSSSARGRDRVLELRRPCGPLDLLSFMKKIPGILSAREYGRSRAPA